MLFSLYIYTQQAVSFATDEIRSVLYRGVGKHKFMSIRLILFSSTLFLSSLSHGQERLDLAYFTLGLVNDYLGREYIKGDQQSLTKVDEFHETEIELINCLDSLIDLENKFRDRTERIDKKFVRRSDKECPNCNEFFIYKSKYLAQHTNSKYKFRFSKSWDMRDRKIYYGRLKKRTIKTPEQKIAFLTGVFIRYGMLKNGIYTIHLANSTSKFDLIQSFLKDIGCEILNVKINTQSVPIGQYIEFMPNDRLKSELQKMMYVRRKIESQKSLVLSD